MFVCPVKLLFGDSSAAPAALGMLGFGMRNENTWPITLKIELRMSPITPFGWSIDDNVIRFFQFKVELVIVF